MTKVLLMPVGVGLAHTGRLVTIAKELQAHGMEVIFGAGEDAPLLIEKEGFPYRILPEFDREIYDLKIKNNNWSIYTTGIIDNFVKAEVNLINEEKPDVIVSDTRITAKISSKITGIPLVSVNNVDATKYYDFSKIRIPYKSYLGKILPVKVTEFFDKERGQRILRRLGPRIARTLFLNQLLRFNYVLAKYHQRPLLDPYDMALGDLTLLCDLPEYRPVKNLPNNIKMVGPIFWDGVKSLPSWAGKIDSKNHIIYVTASGTGDREIFLKVLSYFQDSPFTIIATTGNTITPDKVHVRYPNLYVTDYLPGSWIMQRAELAVFPGGNSTAYQTLNYAVPQIGIPFHLDQEDNLNQLVRLGTGMMLLPDKSFDQQKLLGAVDEILKNKSYKENAKKIRTILKKYDGIKKGAEEIINFIRLRKKSHA